MSTNYYNQEQIYKKCDCCGRDAEFKEIHIGKYSLGWRFAFNNKFKSAKEWINFLSNSPGVIVDEYGREISITEFEEMVKSSLRYDTKRSHETELLDAEGYRIVNIDSEWT